MKKEKFDDYIARFNRRDTSGFDEYIAPNMKMTNGGLVFYGAEGMKDHYKNKIWPTYKEELHVERFFSDEENVAIEMWAHFTAERDDPASLFGPVKKGETFDYRGLILYKVENGKFIDIKVAYLSFIRTGLDGMQINLGLPH
jgi:SnoaL-like domain